MKVGILTFQFADNYGAVLQCLALQEACKKYAEQVQVVNYIPAQMVSTKYKIKKTILKTKIEKKFEQFRKNHFHKMSVKDFCDVLLVGSDQVWNFGITGYDDFWIFPKMNYKRLCSYAASFGKNELSEKEADYLSCHKKDYERYFLLTVREKSGQNFLKEMDIEAETVCDPTMLFYNNTELYDKLAQKSDCKQKEKYLLVYSLEYSETLENLIDKVKEETGYRVLAIHPMNACFQKCDEIIEDASVYDFLALIKNAEIVLTNSFHGLAFSYIFRKKVYCVHHSALSSRQSELIEKSEFQCHVIADNICLIDGMQKTDALDQFIENSEERLAAMLNV